MNIFLTYPHTPNVPPPNTPSRECAIGTDCLSYCIVFFFHEPAACKQSVFVYFLQSVCAVVHQVGDFILPGVVVGGDGKGKLRVSNV